MKENLVLDIAMGEEEQVFCVGDGTDMFMAGFSVMSNDNDSNDTDNPLV